MKIYATIIMLASALSLSASEILVPECGRGICGTTPDASSSAGPVHPALEVGLALGVLEMGSRQGVELEILVGHLKLAKRRSEESAIGPLRGIDELIVGMETAKDRRKVYASVIAFREKVEQQIRKAYPNPPLPEPDPAAVFHCEPADWTGVWRTNYGPMTLAFHGEGTLAGTYGPSQHAVSGGLNPGDPTVYSGVWKHTTSDWTGLFRFRMTGKGTFEGTWTSGDQNPAVSPVNWTGSKVEDGRAPLPEGTQEGVR